MSEFNSVQSSFVPYDGVTYPGTTQSHRAVYKRHKTQGRSNSTAAEADERWICLHNWKHSLVWYTGHIIEGFYKFRANDSLQCKYIYPFKCQEYNNLWLLKIVGINSDFFQDINKPFICIIALKTLQFCKVRPNQMKSPRVFFLFKKWIQHYYDISANNIPPKKYPV